MGGSTSKPVYSGYGALGESTSKEMSASPPQSAECIISSVWSASSLSRQTLEIRSLAEQLRTRDKQMGEVGTSEHKKERSNRAMHWLQLVNPSADTLRIVARELSVSNGLDFSEMFLVMGSDDYVRFSVKMHGLDSHSQFFEERLHVFLLRNSLQVITIQESRRLEPLLKDVYHKINTQSSRLRKCGDPSFMLYELIDAAIDYTFDLVLSYEDSILDMERSLLLEDQSNNPIPPALLLKRTLCIIRINMWRIRELLVELRSDEYGCISSLTQGYLLQATEHCEHVVELTSASIDSVKDVEGLIRQGRQARADSTLMTLTSVSLFLLPAQFITGIYGMNFDNMPELHWEHGYFMCLFIIVLIFILVACYLLLFSRKNSPILKDSSARRSYLRQDFIQRQAVIPDVFRVRKRVTAPRPSVDLQSIQ